MNAHPISSRQPVTARGFTLVELLVSMAVLSVLMIFHAQVLSDTQRTWGLHDSRDADARLRSWLGYVHG